MPFVRQRLTQMLEGKGETVVRTLRRLAKDRGMGLAQQTAIRRICHNLCKNRRHVR